MKKFQRKIKYKNKVYNSVYEACNKLKISYSLVLTRLARGESVDNAFYKGKLTVKTKKIVIDKKIYRSLEEARRKLNPSENSRTVQGRFKRGLPIKKALGLIRFKKKDRERIKFRGKTYESLSELARTFNVDPTLFIRRIKSPKYKHKFSIAQALNLVKIKGKGFIKQIKVNGKKFDTMSKAAQHYGYSPTTVNKKLLEGWTPEQALGLKKRKGHHPNTAGIIYLIKNKINNKIYIGASFGTLANRWNWHIKRAHIKTKKGSLAEAILEFGSKNFSKRIISRSNDLSKEERLFIKKYGSMAPNGYNLSTGGIGFGNLGRKIVINGKRFNNLKNASKYFKIDYKKFISRIHSKWSPDQAAGLQKPNIPKNNVQVKIDGIKFDSVRDASKYYGVNDNTARNRIKNGWDIKDAVTTKKINLSKKIKFNGKTFNSIRKLAKYYKVSSGTLAGKLSKGMPIKKALNL